MQTIQTFHFSTRAGQGRPVSGTPLKAVGERLDATTLADVERYAYTDKVAHETLNLLSIIGRYACQLAGHDNHLIHAGYTNKDYNEELGKVAVRDVGVSPKLDGWRYSANAVLEFDPGAAGLGRTGWEDDRGNPLWFQEGLSPTSMDLEVANPDQDRVCIQTLPDGSREVRFRTSVQSALFVVNGERGSVEATFDPPLSLNEGR